MLHILIMRLIDQIDRDLLKLLRSNARMSVTELAQTLSMSRATVKSRVDALEKDGIILRFTVETDARVETDPIQAISLIAISGQRTESVQRLLQRMPQVFRLYSTNGAWDLVAETQTQNLADFDAALNKIGQINGVRQVETCLLLTRLA